ncbi:MAG: histidine kinase, partial [Actinomycetota bacterium]
MATEVRRYLRDFLNEPRVPDPPRRVWRDWAIVGVLATVMIAEGVFRPDVVWRPAALAMGLGLLPLTLWRRQYPLGTLAITFGLIGVVDIIALLTTDGVFGLYSMAFILIYPYAVFRWGSGRDGVIGVGILLAVFVISIVRDSSGLGDIIGGFIVLFFPAELAGTIRYWVANRDRRIEQARSTEREQLARELHDTVAHHVSAIAIQAQAGQAVAGERPDLAVEALAVIEREASRTLTEMRTMIGALRHDDDVELAPQRGVADIQRLARPGARPTVEVELAGDVDALPPSIDTALYRLAQESITNAVRHARHASRIAVRLVGDGDCIRLTVDDDGEPVSGAGANGQGYGLIGMEERAALLGGTMEAGPRPDRGWSVRAELPRTGG